ncbi:AraC family transcriptional regulator [Sorangium sp. So ce1078]|uniref:AraC family transcriptional regulator n=1 Tax=Sorangium sp. So ce1078 TaxID=3133329 RepID=UPI003F5FC15C
MSSNGHPTFGLPAGFGALAVGTFDMPFGHRFDWHRHPVHQLAWTERGVLAVSIGDRTWILPPTRALWIPAGALHATEASTPATMRSAYFRRRACPVRWTAPTVVAVPPLLRELIRHLSRDDLGPSARRHAQRLVFEILTPLTSSAILVPMPSDARARHVAEALAKDPADRRDLAAFGKSAGASARTLARLFIAETGVTFGQWRSQVRLRAALGHLAAGLPVAVTADRVGYESPSAFVAGFRRQTGVSPGSYFRSADDAPPEDASPRRGVRP